MSDEDVLRRIRRQRFGPTLEERIEELTAERDVLLAVARAADEYEQRGPGNHWFQGIRDALIKAKQIPSIKTGIEKR